MSSTFFPIDADQPVKEDKPVKKKKSGFGLLADAVKKAAKKPPKKKFRGGLAKPCGPCGR